MAKDKVFIIAEAGVNHNGELKKAYELVDIAYKAKVDAVKFQTFKPGECTGKFAIKVDYLKKYSDDSESRYDITKKIALPYKDFLKIQEYANEKGVLFLTTPDGYESLEYVHNVLNVPIIKVSSTEVTHLKFLEEVAKKKKTIFFSTGMSTLKEIEIALGVMKKHNDDITVLHCVSEYPTPPKDVNLRAMVTIKNSFGVNVGYSDHTLGIEAAIAAVAFGAVVIEKHFTIDKTLPGPDHKSSLSPEELKCFVKAIRRVKTMIGNGIKEPTAAELKNIAGIRRSIVAARNLRRGVRLQEKDVTFKRPGYGIHPYDYEKVMGAILKKNMVEDEPLQWEYLE